MELNEAPVLDQLREHWQKMAALIVWKLNGADKPVTITTKDMEQFAKENLTMLTQGHVDGFSFSMVTPERAAEIMKWQAKNHGKG